MYAGASHWPDEHFTSPVAHGEDELIRLIVRKNKKTKAMKFFCDIDLLKMIFKSIIFKKL